MCVRSKEKEREKETERRIFASPHPPDFCLVSFSFDDSRRASDTFMMFRICNFTSSTLLAIRPTGNIVGNRWLAVLLMWSNRGKKHPTAAVGFDWLCSLSPLAQRRQPISAMSIFVSPSSELPVLLSLCLSFPSILSPPSSCCRWEQEREATLQCRHSNNLSPSDQLVRAGIWVADPAATHKERLITGWKRGCLRDWQQIRGAKWQWNIDVWKREKEKEREGETEWRERRDLCK